MREYMVANIRYPRLHAHTHSYAYAHVHTYAFTPRENATRVHIHCKAQGSDLYIRKKKTRGCLFSSPRRDSSRSRRGSRKSSPRKRFRRSASNVAAPTTGKVSKLYSGLRISRISIPYYTTYYLTQTSSRGLLLPRPPLHPPFFSTPLTHPTDFSTQVPSPHLPLNTLNSPGESLSHARPGASEFRDSHSVITYN